MKAKFIQCESCKKETAIESCEFAAHRTVIKGKEYVFCCETCAKNYQAKRKSH